VEEKLPLDEESKIWQNLAKRMAKEASVREGGGGMRERLGGGRVGQLPSPPESPY
jgi:hypothetical protein